jgi:hypothetical protein
MKRHFVFPLWILRAPLYPGLCDLGETIPTAVQYGYDRHISGGYLGTVDWGDAMTGAEQKHWLVRPKTVRLLCRSGLVVLALLVIGDFFLQGHPSFQIDGTFGFYAWFGLVTCVGMVLFAKALGVFLKRKDTYYNDE